ncbi:tRNA (cytidine(34)-2'-O)-methyltransferase [Marivibrio halodurans]|nr:tRNA (cytidine(34)-2'-O)-methyltransferase [Marivibrio halodurans]
MRQMPQLALYQPDIPQNAGAILRLAACMGVDLSVIEPAGFVWSDARMKRAGLDYIAKAHLTRHAGWDAFRAAHADRRLLLFTTAGTTAYTDFAFAPGDVLLFGRESAGVPGAVHDAVDARLLIPMRAGLRSLNVAQCAAMALGETLRQTQCFPDPGEAD